MWERPRLTKSRPPKLTAPAQSLGPPSLYFSFRRRRLAVIDNEVGVFFRHRRIPDTEALQARGVDETRGMVARRIGKHRAAAPLTDRLRGLAPLQQLADYVGEATAVSLVSLNKKWYETDSYKDVREIDILEDKKAEDPTHRLQNRDLMRLVTRGLNRNERLIIILYYY